MTSQGFDTMLAHIRARATRSIDNRYHPTLRSRFDVERKAIIVAEVLDYLGANVPEARELVAEVADLVQQLRTAEEVTPVLRHYL